MNIIILGCGRIGSTLAMSMSKNGHNVTIIDRNIDAFRRLGPDFNGAMVLGNGIDEDILKESGIEKANSFVAVTNGDNTNIMSVQIAKEKFQVKQAVARIYDPIRACAYQGLGIDVFCTTIVSTRLLREHLLGKEWSMLSEYCALDEKALV